ncbi:ankyrin repeat-containing domain protein [Trichoderma asperelloides]|nr:ankyrin repeat-containing domain protein [Trichoderma asperelloides]
MRGKGGIVKVLLEAKADPNAVGDNDGWRPIHAAYDNPEILELLLEAGASKYFGAKTCCYIDRETELSVALLSGKSEIVLLLLENGALLSFNFDVNERDENGSVALHNIDSLTTKLTLEILIRRGANTNVADYSGTTPLLSAIQRQSNEAVDYLVSKGADVNMPTGQYGTALNMACYSGKLESVTNLVENKANVNFSYTGLYGTPLHSAMLRPDDDEKYRIIEYLLRRKELDLHQSVPWWGGYLGLACLCGSLSLLSTLTAKDSTKVNEADKIGRRPIHFALYRTLDHVKYLLRTGAAIEGTDRMKRNALHFAVVSGRLDIVRYVLAKNMDLTSSRDIDNWTPLMWAVRVCGKWDTRSSYRLGIIKELLNHGADRMVEGEGLGRTWTTYELAWYYNLDKEIIDIVTPTPEELQKVSGEEHSALWAYRIKSPKIKGRDGPSDSYCDACLMMLNGILHNCEICENFRLCFKCYRSRNMIHAGHAFHVWREDEEYEGYMDTDLSSYASGSEESSIG